MEIRSSYYVLLVESGRYGNDLRISLGRFGNQPNGGDFHFIKESLSGRVRVRPSRRWITRVIS
jgi:hypothetical protein